MLLMLLVSRLLVAEVPPNGDPWEGEDPAAGPLEVCDAMVKAAKAGDLDGVLGRATAYARGRFGEVEKLQLRAAHRLLISMRCVKLTSREGEATAMVWVYIPDRKSRNVPFVRERGFWRFDQARYEALRRKKK